MATPKLPFDSVEDRFMERTRALHSSMVQRFSEKRNKNGRIIRIGRKVPFTLPELCEWLSRRLGGENGVVKCRFCAEWLSVDTLVLDHSIPVSQGGSLEFDNLDIICKRDNDSKGGMTAASYEKLLDWSALNLPPACRNNMLHRLSIAVQLAAQRRWDIVKQAKEKSRQPTAVAVMEDDPNF